MEEKLINLIQTHDYLYDVSSRNYMDTQMKTNTWNMIGIEMNKTGEECQKIWCNIRNNYRKALYNRKSKSGQPYSKRRPIKYEKELEFLKRYIHPRKPNLNLDSSSEDTQYSFTEESTNNVNEECTFSRMKNDSHQPSTTAAASPEILNNYIESKKVVDPIDAFFETMANTVKTLPPIIQAQIKRQVFNVVNDAEIKYLEANEIGVVSFVSTGCKIESTEN